MGSPLGPTQRLVLEVLDRWPSETPDPTAREITETINHRARASVYERNQGEVSACLCRLSRRDFVERDWSHRNDAWCWAITSSGRVALTEAAER